MQLNFADITTTTTVYQNSYSRLQVVQNKMIRYVFNYSNRTHLLANDVNEVKGMSIENRIKYLAASHVFNCIDEQAPEYLHVFERVMNPTTITPDTVLML